MMAEAVQSECGPSRASSIWSIWFDQATGIRNLDLGAVLLALVLPWSTTGTVIVATGWVVGLVVTLEVDAFLRVVKRWACILPVAICALALLGTLWSHAPWHERLYAAGPAARLLVLPLLLYHFERTARGSWVFIAFLVSCLLLMAYSWVVAFDPALSLKLYFSKGPYFPVSGIAVKNYIDQSQEFMLCAVVLAYPALSYLRSNRPRMAALCAAISVSFLVNMMFVVISRTALVTMPVMLAVFALMHLRLRTAIAVLCAAALLAAAVWNVSPQLQATMSKFVTDYQHTTIQNNESGMVSRLIYWQRALRFFEDAPVIGHGTGSTRGLFQQAAAGQLGAYAVVVSDPHNQTLNVAVQWGVIGIILLYAMWLVHLLLFRGDGLPAWIGLMVVVQNIFTSLFNSHLFDFQEGWIYVLGVGIAGGMVLRSAAVIPARIADANSDVQLHIAESRDSGSGPSDHPGMTLR
jgi:O-antigen ligase